MPHPDLDRIRSAVQREIDRHGPLPLRVLRIRVYLYANLNKHWKGRFPIKFLWTGINDAVDALAGQGAIRLFSHEGSIWCAPPNCFNGDELTTAAAGLVDAKQAVLAEWVRYAKERDGGGPHLESLVRKAFAGLGYAVAEKPVTLRFPNGKSSEVDVLAARERLVLYVECKNVVTECWQGVRHGSTPSADLQKIRELFRNVASLGPGHHPILVASFVDESFYGFQRRHRGFTVRTLHQFLPNERHAVAARVRDVFKIGHVKPARTLPGFLLRRLEALPGLLATAYP